VIQINFHPFKTLSWVGGGFCHNQSTFNKELSKQGCDISPANL
jgi:hypothetical protein